MLMGATNPALGQPSAVPVPPSHPDSVEALNGRLKAVREHLERHSGRLLALGDELCGTESTGSAGSGGLFPKRPEGLIGSAHETLDAIFDLLDRIGDRASRIAGVIR